MMMRERILEVKRRGEEKVEEYNERENMRRYRGEVRR